MPNPLHRWLVAALTGAFAILISAGSHAEVKVHLTPQERTWIAGNSTLVVGNEMDWAPFDYAEGEVPLGFSIDFIRLVAGKVGLKLTFVNGFSWTELLSKLKSQELDILPAIYKTVEREAFIAFTAPYFSEPSVILVHKRNDTIRAFKDLRGKTVVAVKDYASTRALQNDHPEINLLLVDSVIEGARTVIRKKADAFLNSVGTLSYVLTTLSTLPPIKVIRDPAVRRLENPALHIGVHKKDGILRDILDKGIKAVTPEELAVLKKCWLPFLKAH